MYKQESKKADSSATSYKDSNQLGTFYVVATPIGNLGDLSPRAQKTLSAVDLVLAEDTRHSKRLFNHYGISTKLRSCHEHNELELIDSVLTWLAEGQNIALISDAGTPLISDPGFLLIRALRQNKCQINVVPGPSSIIAALSIAGLPTDKFLYEGFLPAKSGARKQQLANYLDQPRTVVLLESSHRILASLADVSTTLGGKRRVVVARELTKKFETVIDGEVDSVLRALHEDGDQTKGEFVVILEGSDIDMEPKQAELHRVMSILLESLSLKQASQVAVKLLGCRKNEAYEVALEIKNAESSE